MYNRLKYSLVKFLEKIPIIQMLIYNNLILFKFLLPQEKDYLGLKYLFNYSEKKTFVDIGGNIGLSTASFRELGFKNNEILIFEPDKFLIKKYLNKLKNYYKNIKIYSFGLSDKEEIQILYKPKYKNLSIHLNNSFSKDYVLDKIRNNYPDKYSDFRFDKQKFNLNKFDNINYKKKICFIKIDVEGFDHLVIRGMKKFLKKNKPVFLIEFNKSNFNEIWQTLKYNYNCFSFNIDGNYFKKFSYSKIKRLIKGHIFDNRYNKNSINLFLIPKNFKKK